MTDLLHRILIVDDDPLNVRVLVELLRGQYALAVARDGRQTLERLREGPLPDLILLDVMMPELDGYEVCRQVKSDPRLAHIPVLFVTALNQPLDEAAAFEAGGADFITKPISPAVLQARLQVHLRGPSGTADPGEAPADAASGAATPGVAVGTAARHPPGTVRLPGAPLSRNETLDEARIRNVREALAEDVGTGDWTAQLVPAHRRVRATVVVRETAVLCGRAWFEAAVQACDTDARLQWAAQEGDTLQPGQVVVEIEAQARALLTAERTALNFLQLLSATATRARSLATLVQDAAPPGHRCVVLDTRKTLPGLRLAQKYAVRCGGGENQRLALWDGILIKENHIAAAGSIAAALQAAAALQSGVPVQVEVESLDELLQALAAGATSVLLDNFTPQELAAAVRLNAGRALLEASGGVSETTIAAVAATGVDRISVGSLTKDVRATDYSLRVQETLA